MKHDKYCELCRRRVATLHTIELDKDIVSKVKSYHICIECLNRLRNQIRIMTV